MYSEEILHKRVFTVEPRYNRDTGTVNITLLYRGKKQRNIYKELGPAEL